jgi:Ankyrin repeat
MLACGSGNLKLAQWMFRTQGVDVHARDAVSHCDGYMVARAHDCFCRCEHASFRHSLVTITPSVLCPLLQDGWTAFVWACGCGNPELAEWLVMECDASIYDRSYVSV